MIVEFVNSFVKAGFHLTCIKAAQTGDVVLSTDFFAG